MRKRRGRGEEEEGKRWEEERKRRRKQGEFGDTNVLPVAMVKIYVLETVPLKVGALCHCFVVQVVQLI